MMKTKFRIIFPALLCSVLLLASCGGTDIGVSSEEILIGTWAPMTGEFENLGNWARSMEAYFKHVNDQGGIHGRRVNLIIKDDNYNPERTREVVNELLTQDRVFCIVGGIGTAHSLAVKDDIQIRLVPWINPGSGSSVWTNPMHAYTFSILPTDPKAAQILTRYAVEDLELTKIGVFHQNDSFGAQGQEGVRLALRRSEKEAELVASVAYNRTDEDFVGYAKELQEAEAEAVVLWGVPSRVAGLVAAMGEIDYHPQLLGHFSLADARMTRQGEAWEGAIVASGAPDIEGDEPGVKRARAIAEQYAPDIPFGDNVLMAMSWAELLAEGMERAGPELTRIALISALERITDWDDNLLGQPFSFSVENHLGFDSVVLKKVEGGKYVTLTDWLE